MEIEKMQRKIKKMFWVFEKMPFEYVAGISFNYDENTCDR